MTQGNGFPGTPYASTWIGAVLARSGGVLRSAKRHAIKALAAIALVGMTVGAQAQEQVAEREQREQLCRVLGQPAIARLHVAELALDDPEGVLDLGPDHRDDAVDPRGRW